MGIKKTGILKGGIHCSVLGSTILDPDGRSHFYPELHPWQLDLLSKNALGCRWENVELSRAKVCRLSLPTPLSPIITWHFSTAFQFVCTNMATFCKHVDAIEVHTPPSIREKYQNNYSTDIYSPTDNILNFNIGKMAKIWANPVCKIDTDKSRFWGSYWKLFMAVYVLSEYCFCSVWVETKSGKFFSKLLSRRGNWLKSFQAGRWKTVSTSRKAFPTDVLKTLQDCKTALTSQF